MTLERIEIRRWARDLLLGNTDAGDNVKVSRSVPNIGSRAAGLAIYTSDENIERVGSSPAVFERVLELNVEGFVREDPELDADADAQDLVDRLMEQVECCILPQLNPAGFGAIKVRGRTIDEDPGWNPSKSGLVGFDSDFADDAEQIYGAGRLRFEIVYATLVDESELAQVARGDHVAIDYDIHADAGAEAEDLLEIDHTTS